MKPRRYGVVPSFLSFILLIAPWSRAADRFWTNTIGGDFLNPLNWSPNIVPDAADNANFNNPIFPGVTFSASRTNANVLLNGTSGGIQAAIGPNLWRVTNSFVIAQNSGTTGVVFHSSGRLIVTNAAGTGRLVVGQNGRGVYQLSGGSITADQLWVTNVTPAVANSTFLLLAGDLTVQSLSRVLFTNSQFVIGTGNAPSMLNLNGGTHNWGLGGSTTELVIGSTNSGQSSAVVSGPSTVWSNRCRMVFGSGNSGGTLGFVIAGATLWTTDNVFLGRNSAATNAVAVGDAGSVWHGTTISVGEAACTNARLFVVNGGQLILSNILQLGNLSSAVSNLVVVADANSMMSNGANTFVGLNGGGNTLAISNRGTVFSRVSYVGLASDGNRAIVLGTNSMWSNSVTLIVGSDADSNRLEVLSGGSVFSGTGQVGGTMSALSNTASISGIGSVWSVNTSMLVGNAGRSNLLSISDGGSMLSGTGSVGHASTATNNTVLITGAGSSWTNSGPLTIGNGGVGGRVRVENDASLRTLELLLGLQGTARTNTLELDANGSCDVLGNVSLGVTGAVNQITLDDKASMTVASNLIVGVENGSSNNVLTVGHNAELTVGSGTNGQLNIRRGFCLLSEGSISAPQLFMTNTQGHFEHNGGLLLTRGAFISNGAPFVVGRFDSSKSAVWDVRSGAGDHVVSGSIIVGSNASNCRLLVSEGATLVSSGNGVLSATTGASSNLAIISGPGSRWLIGTDLHVGEGGGFNRLVITNDALLTNEISVIGLGSSSNNEVVVSGAGSAWKSAFNLFVGSTSSGNRLIVTNGASGSANSILIGASSTSTNNRLVVHGGVLRSTNAPGSGLLEIRRGTNELYTGLVEVDRLLITNTLGQFEFEGGTLITKNTTNNNGRVFGVGVGNGAGPGILHLAGNGFHFFANGLSVNNSGSLIGNGTIIGVVTVQVQGTLSPGTSIGKLILNNPPVLLGETLMEISKNSSTLTNDQVQVNGTLTYSGALTVTKIGPTGLSGGDRFQLFAATGYGAAFSAVTLPPLSAGLTWTNKLALDGSIEVLGRPAPQIANILQSGTNVVISGTGGPTNATYFVLASTNVALPLTNWTPILTNQFNSSGNFLFTNAIVPAIPRRFFVLLVP